MKDTHANLALREALVPLHDSVLVNLQHIISGFEDALEKASGVSSILTFYVGFPVSELVYAVAEKYFVSIKFMLEKCTDPLKKCTDPFTLQVQMWHGEKRSSNPYVEKLSAKMDKFLADTTKDLIEQFDFLADRAMYKHALSFTMSIPRDKTYKDTGMVNAITELKKHAAGRGYTIKHDPNDPLAVYRCFATDCDAVVSIFADRVIASYKEHGGIPALEECSADVEEGYLTATVKRNKLTYLQREKLTLEQSKMDIVDLNAKFAAERILASNPMDAPVVKAGMAKAPTSYIAVPCKNGDPSCSCLLNGFTCRVLGPAQSTGPPEVKAGMAEAATPFLIERVKATIQPYCKNRQAPSEFAKPVDFYPATAVYRGCWCCTKLFMLAGVKDKQVRCNKCSALQEPMPSYKKCSRCTGYVFEDSETVCPLCLPRMCLKGREYLHGMIHTLVSCDQCSRSFYALDDKETKCSSCCPTFTGKEMTMQAYKEMKVPGLLEGSKPKGAEVVPGVRGCWHCGVLFPVHDDTSKETNCDKCKAEHAKAEAVELPAFKRSREKREADQKAKEEKEKIYNCVDCGEPRSGDARPALCKACSEAIHKGMEVFKKDMEAKKKAEEESLKKIFKCVDCCRDVSNPAGCKPCIEARREEAETFWKESEAKKKAQDLLDEATKKAEEAAVKKDPPCSFCKGVLDCEGSLCTTCKENIKTGLIPPKDWKKKVQDLFDEAIKKEDEAAKRKAWLEKAEKDPELTEEVQADMKRRADAVGAARKQQEKDLLDEATKKMEEAAKKDKEFAEVVQADTQRREEEARAARKQREKEAEEIAKATKDAELAKRIEAHPFGHNKLRESLEKHEEQTTESFKKCIEVFEAALNAETGCRKSFRFRLPYIVDDLLSTVLRKFFEKEGFEAKECSDYMVTLYNSYDDAEDAPYANKLRAKIRAFEVQQTAYLIADFDRDAESATAAFPIRSHDSLDRDVVARLLKDHATSKGYELVNLRDKFGGYKCHARAIGHLDLVASHAEKVIARALAKKAPPPPAEELKKEEETEPVTVPEEVKTWGDAVQYAFEKQLYEPVVPKLKYTYMGHGDRGIFFCYPHGIPPPNAMIHVKGFDIPIIFDRAYGGSGSVTYMVSEMSSDVKEVIQLLK